MVADVVRPLMTHAEQIQDIQVFDKPVGIRYQIFPEGIDEPEEIVVVPAGRGIPLP